MYDNILLCHYSWKPKKFWKRSFKTAEQQKQILDGIQKTMEQNEPIQQQIQNAYIGNPNVDRERQMFGEWFTAALQVLKKASGLSFGERLLTLLTHIRKGQGHCERYGIVTRRFGLMVYKYQPVCFG